MGLRQERTVRMLGRDAPREELFSPAGYQVLLPVVIFYTRPSASSVIASDEGNIRCVSNASGYGAHLFLDLIVAEDQDLSFSVALNVIANLVPE